MYYSVLWNSYKYLVRRRKDGPDVPGVNWTSGKPVPPGTITAPLRVDLKTFEVWNEEGPALPDFFGIKNPPILSKKLYNDLVELGVDNVEAYPIDLHDPDDGSINKDYVVLNIVGLIHAADLKQSTYRVNPGGSFIDMTFDKLIIDANKVGRAMMFHLAENTMWFFVNETIKEGLTKKGYPGLKFNPAASTAFL